MRYDNEITLSWGGLLMICGLSWGWLAVATTIVRWIWV